MARHHGQVELLVPGDRRQIAEDPVDVRALPRDVEHPPAGVESDQPSGVSGLTRPPQQRSGAAPDIEYRLCRHHQRQIEAKVVPTLPAAQRIVQRGQMRLGELKVDHDGSLYPTRLPGVRD